ncbi:hypothetical protein BY996DRAFT_7054485 [Phakopsora pachyrhizi]|nr:hypothetical protein BY996DRAFT_7054485 [Phakopsora pachyrhizi]
MQTLHNHLLHKEFVREIPRSNAVYHYHRFQFGRTSNFLHTSAIHLNLSRGFTYLSLLLMSALPTTNRRKRNLAAINVPCQLQYNVCPFCSTSLMEDTSEWTHILMNSRTSLMTISPFCCKEDGLGALTTLWLWMSLLITTSPHLLRFTRSRFGSTRMDTYPIVTIQVPYLTVTYLLSLSSNLLYDTY